MSVITDMVILTIADDRRGMLPIEALNAWCRENAHGQEFREINAEHAGGHKVFCSNVYACAGNYFPWMDLMEAFPSFPWDSVQANETILLVKPEHEERWLGITAKGLRIASGRFTEDLS